MIPLMYRDQRKNAMAKAIFILDVCADRSDAELSGIRKYEIGETELYAFRSVIDRGDGLLGA